MSPPYSSMSPEDRYEAQVKEFGLFFLGVGVGVFCTIILFIYGCFTGSCISSPKSPSSTPSTSSSTDNPPAYSSLRKLEAFIGGVYWSLGIVYVIWVARFLYKCLRHFQSIRAIQNGYPVTSTPQGPLTHLIRDADKGWRPKDQFGVVVGSRQFVSAQYLVAIQEFVRKLHPDESKFVPFNTLSVSVAQRGFQVGATAQSFVPQNGKPSPDAFYTYQMVSPNVELTYWNEDRRQFLAGFCVFPTVSEPNHVYLYTEEQAIRYALMIAEPYPMQERSENGNFRNFRKYGRWCHSAGKRVIVYAKEGAVARHFLYNYFKRKPYFEHCHECASEAEGVARKMEKALENPTATTPTVTNFSVELNNECEEKTTLI